MKIVERPIDSITPYENNPRINDQAVDAVAASIKEFGWNVPIVCDENWVVIAGHTRLKAARQLGMTKVPVYVAKGLSAEQIKAYRIADNATAARSQWDDEKLTKELLALQSEGFDLDLTGFTGEDLLRLLNSEPSLGLTDPDDVPAPPDEAVTQPGDLWILGEHRLLCGDSGKPEDVDRLLAGAQVHMVNTDPPYNVKVEPRSNNAIAAGLSSFQGPKHHQKLDVVRHPEKAKPTGKKLRAKDRPLANDYVSAEAFDHLLQAWFGNIARVLQPGRAFYVWGGYSNLANYPPVLKANELYFSQGIVWVKEHPVLTRKDFLGNFELGYYGWREGAAHQFFGPNNVVDVWSIKKISPQQMEHLTSKPAELAARAIQYSSRPKENVLDLFGGSGSTLIAAEQLNRRAYLMELDSPYCDVIADRFQRFTGKPAVLERTGKSPIPMKPREANMR